MLYSYIQGSQLKNYISTTPSNYEINNAALNLGFKVIGNPEDRKKGGEAIVNMKEQTSLLKTLSLAYYGNQLFVYFRREAFIAHSISLALQKAPGQPVAMSTIITNSLAIQRVFKNEFLPILGELDDQSITALMNFQVKLGWYQRDKDGNIMLPKNTVSL
jgi:hypothetical protein